MRNSLNLRSFLVGIASIGLLGVSMVGLVGAAGCGNEATVPSVDMMPPAPAAALAVCSHYLPSAAQPSTGVASGGNATAETISNSGACTEVTTAVVRGDAADIVPMGYSALGGAIAFSGPDGMAYPHGLDFMVPCDLAKAPTGAASSRIVVVEKSLTGTISVAAVSNVTYEGAYKRLHFHSFLPGTFQCAIPSTAGQKRMRHYTFRGIGGVSMGGIGSSHNFWKHPELYDSAIVMGADPGPDLTYTLGILHDWFFAGFCTAEDGLDKIGKLCPSTRKPMLEQFETAMDYEHLIYQKGDGVGLTLRRTTYMRAFRDLSRAFGNAAYASDPNSTAAFHTFVPPGVPASTIMQTPTDACDPKNAVVLKNFYDWRYNPTGTKDVITFCDGGDSEAKGLGTFDDSLPQTDPTQIILAVDVGDGKGGAPDKKRESGEPVVLQASEHFYDWGVDGLADEKEPGYDAVKNPDPNHDDYHYLHNPTGTEKNWRYDAGEKYDDFGVDGVKGKGCSVDSKDPSHHEPLVNADNSIAGCYDFGEGNGKFDYSASAANWQAHDPRTLLEALAPDQLDRLATYYDAGIRDFLNAQVSTNSLSGALTAKGAAVRIWDGFPAMVGAAPSEQRKFNVNNIDFSTLGRHAYVRYGDPDSSQAVVESNGDGRHVGTADQAAARALLLFYFVSHQWPDGDTEVPPDLTGGEEQDLTFTAASGRVTPYSVVLPPGYNDDVNKTKTYPVVYMMHGYGMDPKGLAAVAVIASSAMVNTDVPAEKRLQKMIIVLVDAQCRPKQDAQDPGGLNLTTGDLCEEGTFYGEHADGTAKAESQLLELQKIVDGKYRVKAPRDIEVTD